MVLLAVQFTVNRFQKNNQSIILKILITGGKSALAIKLLKAFAQYEVVFADYGEMPNFSSATYNFISLGEKNEDTIAHNLLNSCLNEQVDMVLPVHKFEIEPIAKASVLYNEFNIELLLPRMEDMGKYFEQKNLTKQENWAVFRKGRLLFSTMVNHELIVFGEKTGLNGVYYFLDDAPVANLALITI